MKEKIYNRTNKIPALWLAALVGLPLVLSSADRAEAQRPSFGGLQRQLDDLRVGDSPFTEVAVSERVRFGGGECTIGLIPGLPGLTESDPTGFRLLGPDNQGCRLIFGPTMDCTVEIDPLGPPGLLLRDLRGIRILNPDPQLPPQLFFGPTDDCSLGVFPDLPGLTESDPVGFRLLGQDNQGCRLIFGPTMDCTVEVDPLGPPGLLLRDLRGIRILNPDPQLPPRLLFGPTDDCTLGLDPELPGLIENDPTGFRLLGQDGQGCRLIFGPTMDCTVEIDPLGPPGLLLRDVRGVRLLPPGDFPPLLIFGPTDDCTIGIDPRFRGLSETDPNGFRLLGQDLQGCELLFGPTDLCRIYIDPEITGMFLEDPNGFTFQGPGGTLTQVTVVGEIFSRGLPQSSARELKENIQPLTNALDTVKKLRGVSFDWKAEQGGKAAIGFIADEVAEIVPEITSYDETGKPRGVQYANVVPLLVEGVKTQQVQIESLQAQNGKLKEELESLKETQDNQLRDELNALRAQVAELAKQVNP